MPSLTIRNIPDRVLERLRRVAAEEKRSVNAQALQWLEAGARRPGSPEWEEVFDRIRSTRKAILRRHGRGTDVTGIIREMRDERARRRA